MKQSLEKKKLKDKLLSTPFFICVLGVLAVLFLRNILFVQSGMILQGADLVQTYYQKFICREAFLEGHLPLWNPYLYCGYPYLAHPYNEVFYPLNLLFLLMPLNIAYSWIFAVHVFLSGVFMFLLVKYLVREEWAAFVSAICFMFSGYTATRIWAGHYEVYASSIWIPLIFLMFLKSLHRKSFIFSMMTGFCLAIQFFAGHTQTFFFTVMILAAYTLYVCLGDCARLTNRTIVETFRALISKLKFFIASMLFFTMIAAAQLIPTFELIKLSTRGNGNPFFMSAYGSFPPEHLVRFMIPDFFGNFLKTLYAGDPLVGEIHWEFTYYIGILPLLMAVYIAFKKMSEKTRRVSLLLIGSVVTISGLTRGLFLMLWHIRNNPAGAGPKLIGLVRFFEKVYSSQVSFVQLLPVFLICLGILVALLFIIKRRLVDCVANTRKNNGLILFFGIMCFLGIVLSFGQYAPLGLYYILYKFIPGYNSFKWPARHLIISNFTLCILAGYWMKGLSRHKIIRIGIVLIILLDLFIYTGKFFYLKRLDIFYPQEQVTDFMQKDNDLFRVLILPVLKPNCVFEPSCVEFQANACIPLKLYNISGYDPMIIRRFHELTNALQGNRLDDFGNTSIRLKDLGDKKLLKLLNTKYVFTDKTIDKYKLSYDKQDIAKEFDKSCIVKVAGYIGRFNFVEDAVIAESDQQILSILHADDFNPREIVVLESWQNPPKLSSGAESKQESKIEVIYYGRDRIKLKINASGMGYLSASEIFYPGWRAFINGRRAKIYRSNYAMRALYIPAAGEYKIEFKFEPHSLKIGMMISLASIGFIIVSLIIIVMKRW